MGIELLNRSVHIFSGRKLPNFGITDNLWGLKVGNLTWGWAKLGIFQRRTQITLDMPPVVRDDHRTPGICLRYVAGHPRVDMPGSPRLRGCGFSWFRGCCAPRCFSLFFLSSPCSLVDVHANGSSFADAFVTYNFHHLDLHQN